MIEGWGEVEELFKNAPMTWFPAMLHLLVENGYKKKVFKPSGASRLIAAYEEKHGLSETGSEPESK